MNKKELRAKYKTLRSHLSNEEVENLSIDIANQLLKLPVWEKSYYHIFLSIDQKKEINTEFLLNILLGKDKNVIVSKSNFEDNTLHHFLLTDTTVLKVNSWGIPEPVDGIPIPEDKIEVVFVPLLAFDQKGNRVGYGKGFYDKFLAKCNPNTLKIGLSFFSAEEEIENVTITDVSLDFCVTPTEIYAIKK
ncbi:5-formyltetrahydrofolate cyclo-ligase [Aquimarina sp. MAR_2010_214]|uniref:5-formyltetrahydrofolate cyclo-ligase n=1 Tax=Aquimarina sp. MAR_2010_214 TaxID=1250026 RepID=UPI000C704D03|nr:5-formyltetrahydrofolate cyclo-ligase [Aquimarina sp. MAR_2010_214]PKV48507.1 5-formyltetrahydrofolate cyclo-ligase [Aquimarina sp. MAR_2010_214]